MLRRHSAHQTFLMQGPLPNPGRRWERVLHSIWALLLPEPPGERVGRQASFWQGSTGYQEQQIRMEAQGQFAHCTQACHNCADHCPQCATCIYETEIRPLQRCMQLDLECSLRCNTAAGMRGLAGEYSYRLCVRCAEMCTACADEWQKHSNMGHCRAGAGWCHCL